jgi:hypothetical protein
MERVITMTKTDRIFGFITVGSIIFLFCFCTGWWLSYILKFNMTAGIIVGSLAGIAIDIAVLPKAVTCFFEISPVCLALIYAFYMIGIFGFCMGVPILNVIPGIMAAFYTSRKMRNIKADKMVLNDASKKVYVFSAVGLAAICICSAAIAISDPYTAENIEGMLGLGFKLNDAAIWGIISVGGTLLMITQFFMEKLTFKLSFRSKERI